MSGQDANSKDMLSRIHEQRVKDQNNDSTKPVRSPMVKAKKRISLDAKVTRTRLYSQHSGHDIVRLAWLRLCDPDKQHDIHL